MLNDYITHGIYVAMYNTVYKGLPYCVMSGCLFLPYSIFNHEGPGKRLYHVIVNPYIKLIQISLP